MKRLISKILICSIVLQSISPFVGISNTIAFANEIEQSIDIPSMTAELKDINFIEGSLEDTRHLKYTYTLNGKEYMVIEDTNEDLSHVESTVYQNVNGEFIEIANQELNFQGNELVCTLKQNGNKQIKSIEIRPEAIEQQILPRASYNGMDVSNWIHSETVKSSSDIYIYTFASILALVGNIISYTSLGVGTKVIVGATTNIASFYLGKSVPTIYYTRYTYYKTVLPDDPDLFRMKVAERNVYRFYEDKGRTKECKEHIETEGYLRGYED